jgi:valacyclovir hydrolase
VPSFPYQRVDLPDGAPLSFVDEGHHRPLVMLHGFSGTAHRHIATLVDEFRSEYRVLAPDLRGYGASRPPGRDFPPNFIERDADDVAYLLDVTHYSQSVVLGFSDGGESALVLAAKRPDLVRGLVVWGAFGQVPASALHWLESLLPIEAWGPDLAEWRESLILHHGQEQWPVLVIGYVECERALAAAGWSLPLDLAGRIRCPVLQLHGDAEQRANEKEVAQLASAIPHGRLDIIPGADHSLQMEAPDLFVRRVRSFVEELPE